MSERWGYTWIVSKVADETMGERLRCLAEENMREAAALNGGVALGEIWHTGRIEFVTTNEPLGDGAMEPCSTDMPVERAQELGLDIEGQPRFYLDRYEADVVGRT